MGDEFREVRRPKAAVNMGDEMTQVAPPQPYRERTVPRPRKARWRSWSAGIVVVVVVALLITALILARRRPHTPAVTGATLDQPLPAVSLVDQHGRPVSWSAFRGRVVVLAPFLTNCHETCPFTAGAFIELAQALRARHLAGKVSLAEVTVDPGRDEPSRLAAYATLTGDPATLLTGSTAALDQLWSALGIDHEATPKPPPYQPDWFTGAPDTYDVGHTDAVFVVDERGHERVVIVGPAVPTKELAAPLRQLLTDPSAKAAPREEGWTPSEALDDAIAVLHHRAGPSTAVPIS
jgi:protein SCO1/2